MTEQRREYLIEYRKKNHEKRLAYNKQYRLDHQIELLEYRNQTKEKKRLTDSAYRERNKEHKRSIDANYREKTKAQRQLYDAARYARERDQMLAVNREYRKQNKEAIKKNQAEWRQNNPDKVRSYRKAAKCHRRIAVGYFTASQWRQLKNNFGNVCLRCGISELELSMKERVAERSLTPDHVIPIIKGGTNWITNIQPLCLTCNQRNYWDNLNGTQVDYRLEKSSCL